MKYLIGNIYIYIYRYTGKELTENQFKYLLLYKNELNQAEISDKLSGNISIPASTKFERIFKNGFYTNKDGNNVIQADTICEILKMERAVHLFKQKNEEGNESQQGRINLIKTNAAKVLSIFLVYKNLMKKEKNLGKIIKLQNKLLMKELENENEELKIFNKRIVDEIKNENKRMREELQALKDKLN